MNTGYTKLRTLIQSLDLNVNETFDVSFELDFTDKRMPSISILVQTESIYLRDINKLLTDVFLCLDKEKSNISRSHNISKEQVVHLFLCFPRIYSLHLGLNKAFKEDTYFIQNIGKYLFEFFSQSELFDIYEKYVTGISNSLIICKTIETNLEVRHNDLSGLENIIMGPIHRLSRLCATIRELWKYTSPEYADKVNLFKAMSISMSLKARIDRLQRNLKFKDLNYLNNSLTKLKPPLSSLRLLSKVVKSEFIANFHSTKKVINIPYTLILCDQDVVMLPVDSSKKTVFRYSIKDISTNQYELSRFNHQDSCFDNCKIKSKVKLDSTSFSDEFNEVKNLYLSIKGTSINDSVFKTYSDLLHDYQILINANEVVKGLNFLYKEIDQLELKITLIELEKQLKEKERDLNDNMSSIVVLKGNTLNQANEPVWILFDSSTKANNWKRKLSRAKILADTETNIDWIYYSTGSIFQKIDISDLPHIFHPFSVKTNIIKNVESIIVKCNPTFAVLGMTFCRCMWIYLANGWIIMLNFDYKTWSMVLSFQIKVNHPMTAMCDYTHVDPVSGNIVDSEIWMAFGNQIFIYSLLNNRCSETKEIFNLQTNITSLCTVEEKMLVALRSNIIIIYGKAGNSIWSPRKEISLDKFVASCDEINEVIYGNNLVYVYYDKRIIICEKIEIEFLTVKTQFESSRKISAFSIAVDGVWMSFEGECSIVLYDELLVNNMQSILIPLHIMNLPPLGNVTNIYTNERYIWIGAENGCIICLTAVDSSYCVDSNIPFYLSSTFPSEPISQLIPFQNFKSISIMKHIKKEFCKIDISKQSVRPTDGQYLSRSISCPNLLISENVHSSEKDVLCNQCLQNAYKQSKSDSHTLLLAIGNGIRKYDHETGKSDSDSKLTILEDSHSTIFTFIE